MGIAVSSSCRRTYLEAVVEVERVVELGAVRESHADPHLLIRCRAAVGGGLVLLLQLGADLISLGGETLLLLLLTLALLLFATLSLDALTLQSTTFDQSSPVRLQGTLVVGLLLATQTVVELPLGTKRKRLS